MAIKQRVYNVFWNKTWKKIALSLIVVLLLAVLAFTIWLDQHSLADYIEAEEATIQVIEDHFWMEQPSRTYINDQLASNPSITDYEINLVGSSESNELQAVTSLLMSTSLSAERKMNPAVPNAQFDWNISTLGLDWMNGSVYQDEQLTVLNIVDWLDQPVGFDQTNSPSLYKQESASDDATDSNVISTIQMAFEFLRELEIEETALNYQENQLDLTLSEQQANQGWEQILNHLDANESLEQQAGWLTSLQIEGEMEYSATYEDDFVLTRDWETSVVNDSDMFDVKLSLNSEEQDGSVLVNGRFLVTNEAGGTVLDIRFDGSSDELLDEQIESEQTLIVEYPAWEMADGIRIDWQTSANSEQNEMTFDVRIADGDITQLASGEMVNQYSEGNETSIHDTELSVSVENPEVFNQDIPFDEWELSIEREHQLDEDVNIQSVNREEVQMFEPAMIEKWRQRLEGIEQDPEQFIEDQIDLPF